MDSPQVATVRRMKRMLGEIVPYLVHQRQKLGSWQWGLEQERGIKPTTTVEPGFAWNPQQWPVWFSKELLLPAAKSDERIWLRSWFGGESCVYVDGRPFGEINVYHREMDITPFCDGLTHLIEIQTVPYGLFGTPEKDVRFTEACLLWKKTEAAKGYKTFQIALELFEQTKNEELIYLLQESLEKAFRSLAIPRGTAQYFQTVLLNPSLAGEASSVWKMPDYPKDDVPTGCDEVHDSLIRASHRLREDLDRYASRFPSQGALWGFGHAHIDYAWLWPLEETKRKIVRTFANALQLTDKYPEFVYTHSSAQMYEDLLEMQPEMFKKIQKKIEQGQWEAVGGMWVEGDCNVPVAESLIRQFVYGQAFFLKHFGKRSRVCWLPDVFGFSWILPQILKQAGIDLFVTTKINWNDTNRFPHDLCLWRGLDGTEVIYHSFDNPTQGYNGLMDVYGLSKTWEHYHQKGVFPKLLYAYGYGDGGGGPTDEMVESFRQLKHAPEVPKLALKRMEDYLHALEQEKELSQTLPKWDGELYLEIHRGTLTSQSRTKRLHKRAEWMLTLWESLAAHDRSNPYPYELLDRCWKDLLKNEFHDILPGSSIKEVYQRTDRELQQIVDQAQDALNTTYMINANTDQKRLCVMNPSPWTRSPLLFLEGKPVKMSDSAGLPLDCQKLDDQKAVYQAKDEVAPFQTAVFDVADQEEVTFSETGSFPETFVMENEILRVEVMHDGALQIEHRQSGRKSFVNSGNQLYMYTDIPNYWDAWDIDLAHEAYAKRMIAKKIEWIHNGPIRWTIRVTYQEEQTTIIQDYHLDRGAERLDIDTRIDWHHRRNLLKAIFPTSVLSRKARFDLSAGYIERPTHRNTSWERARFEVPAHRWVDISQCDFGVAILNDGLYGHSAHGSTIGLTMIKSGVFPDFFADEGHHHFTYAIYPHQGEELLPVIQQAHALNHPLHLHEGVLSFSWLIQHISDPNLMIMALKKSAQGATILRLAEITGGSAQATIRFSKEWSKISKSTIFEETLDTIVEKTDSFSFDYRPFEIMTFTLCD